MVDRSWEASLFRAVLADFSLRMRPFMVSGYSAYGCGLFGGSGGVLAVKGKLPFLLRPIFPLGYALFAPVQQIFLVKPLTVAHLHDFRFQIIHASVGAAVLAARPPVRWSVHVGK